MFIDDDAAVDDDVDCDAMVRKHTDRKSAKMTKFHVSTECGDFL